jgi:SAM-dependent methyltransferase
MIEALSRIDGLTFADLVDRKRVLHFSPEQLTTPLIQPRAGSYRTADFCRDDVDERLDLTNMPSVATGSVDLLIAADVLEHVPDHIQGMCEIFRVLSPGGWAMLTVPQQDGLEKTWGDATVTDPRERERLFGQVDHVRIFGNDVPDLLRSVGFEVRVIDQTSFAPELVKRHVLFPPVLSKRPLATNYRKVFFARKSL